MPASKVITWNDESSANIPGLIIGKVRRDLLGKIRTQAVEVPGRPGGWVFPQELGFRNLVAECFIEVEDMEDRRATMELLYDWLDVRGEARLTISDEPLVFYLAHLGDISDADEWRDYAIFELPWVVQPYCYDLSVTTESWTSTANTNHTFSPGLRTEVYPVIQITPTNGTLIAFTLEANGFSLSYDGPSIASGTSVNVNSIAAVVLAGVTTDSELVGAFTLGQELMAGVGGVFPVLVPGPLNNIHFTKSSGTATSFSIVTKYRKAYRK